MLDFKRTLVVCCGGFYYRLSLLGHDPRENIISLLLSAVALFSPPPKPVLSSWTTKL